jgi:hypothetical protein
MADDCHPHVRVRLQPCYLLIERSPGRSVQRGAVEVERHGILSFSPERLVQRSDPVCRIAIGNLSLDVLRVRNPIEMGVPPFTGWSV